MPCECLRILPRWICKCPFWTLFQFSHLRTFKFIFWWKSRLKNWRVSPLGRVKNCYGRWSFFLSFLLYFFPGVLGFRVPVLKEPGLKENEMPCSIMKDFRYVAIVNKLNFSDYHQRWYPRKNSGSQARLKSNTILVFLFERVCVFYLFLSLLRWCPENIKYSSNFRYKNFEFLCMAGFIN